MDSILAFKMKFVGKRFSNSNSEKICDLVFAHIQGVEALISKFKNSSILNEADEYVPKLFSKDGSTRYLPNNPSVKRVEGSVLFSRKEKGGMVKKGGGKRV